MSRERRQERRAQRQARRQVRRGERDQRRSDRREDRADRRADRAQRIRDEGGSIRRAQRLEGRSARAQGRSDVSQVRADAHLENAEIIIGGTAEEMRVDARLLTQAQWNSFLTALRSLKADGSYWEDLVDEHMVAMNFAHNNNAAYRYGFLTWHRQYLLDFEEDLLDAGCAIRLPYWDWRSRRRVPKHMDVEDWMELGPGGRGKRAAAFGRKIQLNKIERIDNFREMSDTIEGLHNSIHATLGGDMQSQMNSPNDPIFFMHHAFVDKMWDYWQAHNEEIANVHPFPTDALPGYPGLTNQSVMDNDDLDVDYF